MSRRLLGGEGGESDDPSGREEAYRTAYPRVGDALTLTVWREPALHLARWTARDENLAWRAALAMALCLTAQRPPREVRRHPMKLSDRAARMTARTCMRKISG